jgi:hypothetical protein
VGGTLQTQCLVKEVTTESLSWLTESSFIQEGMLPEAGGLNDQWEIDLQAYLVIMEEKEAHNGK